MITLTLHNEPRFSPSVRTRLVEKLCEQDHPYHTNRVPCLDDEYLDEPFCVISAEGYTFHTHLGEAVEHVQNVYSDLERLFPDIDLYIVDLAQEYIHAANLVPRVRLSPLS